MGQLACPVWRLTWAVMYVWLVLMAIHSVIHARYFTIMNSMLKLVLLALLVGISIYTQVVYALFASSSQFCVILVKKQLPEHSVLSVRNIMRLHSEGSLNNIIYLERMNAPRVGKGSTWLTNKAVKYALKS